MALHEQLQELKGELQELFLEREDVLEGMLAGLLTGHHVLLLGPPGTAKSMLAREVCARIKSSIKSSKYFERLLTKFSVPEELFGPISLSELEKDKYVRVTTGKLPEAHIAFLDEIFKASSNILNTLLTLINERLFHNDGKIQNCPLIFMVGASNELPEEESLAALYDRFLLRFTLRYLDEEENFKAMLRLQQAKPEVTITQSALKKMQDLTNNVIIGEEIINALFRLRLELKGAFSISDRRWKESLKIIQAAAFMDGRDRATLDDIFILRNCLWDEPNDVGKIAQTLTQVLFPERAKILDIYDAAVDAYKAFANTTTDIETAGIEAIKKLKDSVSELEHLRTAGGDMLKFRNAKMDEIKALMKKAQERCITA